MTASPLTGVGVLVTRPAHQSAELNEAIESAGGSPILFPVIDICSRDDQQIEADLAELQDPDIIVFVSANAVAHGIGWVDCDNAMIAAVGPATVDALRSAGVSVDISPKGRSDSEHLLEHGAFSNIAGKTITIVRGAPGREVLANTLRERGASVAYLSVYKQSPSAPSSDALESVEKAWRAEQINAVMIMSVASLNNLIDLLPPYCRGQLQKTRLVAPSARVIQTALERIPGATGILAAGPGAAEMTGALIASLQSESDTNNG
jgi:uroporphyrinogen-III synthase